MIAKMIGKVYQDGRKLDAQSIYDMAKLLIPFIRLQSTSFDPTLIVSQIAEFSDYDQRTSEFAEIVLVETFSWMMHNGFMARDFRFEDPNVFVLTRAAFSLDDIADFDMHVRLAKFPFDLLHHSFADAVRIQLERGELTLAVSAAYKVFEKSIREHARYYGLPSTDNIHSVTVRLIQSIGSKVISDGEVQQMHNQITSAFGIYRNPVAHDTREVEHDEMVDAIMVAGAAMRLLDSLLHKVELEKLASNFPRSVA